MNYNNTDDCPELVIKKLCCTCLCRDRKLFQLCRINDGINNLYSLLSYDSEAYRVTVFYIFLVVGMLYIQLNKL